MLKLYFIRHGQSTNNVIYDDVGRENYLVHRSLDPDLTSVGQQQAELVADLVARPVSKDGYDPHNRIGYGVTHIYCSLMMRAVKTGMVISQKTGVPLVAWPEIHETGGLFDVEMQGDEFEFTGKPGPGRSFFESTFPELILPDDLGEEGWWHLGKEPRDEYRDRALGIINRLKEVHGGTHDRVAIITHGGIFARILSALFEIQAEKYWFLMNNCAISRVDIDEDGRFSLLYLNKVDFLPDDLIT